jgi:hypothetical protein
MAEDNAADTRFNRLMALTHEAFTDRHYPTAYYTLVATSRGGPSAGKRISRLCAPGVSRPYTGNTLRGWRGGRSAIVFALPVLRTCFGSWILAPHHPRFPRRRRPGLAQALG